jgi:hypothetical protein
MSPALYAGKCGSGEDTWICLGVDEPSLGKPRPQSYMVDYVQHSCPLEVRVSTFFYFDDNPGRQSINKRMAPEAAEAAARAYAKVQQGDRPPPLKP